MAQPIIFTPARREPREELLHQLEKAPNEHVEAMLDLYAILQLLRDKGLLEIAKGILGSGEKVLEIFTETLEADQVVRAVRNFVILIKIAGAIEPEALEKIVHDLGLGIERAKNGKPPGVLKIINRLRKDPARRALVPVITAIRSAGENLARGKNTHAKRQKTKRHSA